MLMNLGESLFHQGKVEEAITSYGRAVEGFRSTLLRQCADESKMQLAQALILCARAQMKLGLAEQGRACLEESEQLLGSMAQPLECVMDPADAVMRHSIVAEMYRGLGDGHAERRHLESAYARLHQHIARQSASDTWESMLSYWGEVPGRLIRSLLERNQPDDPERCLLVAEGAKGRLLHWMLQPAEQRRMQAVSEERQRTALKAARDYCVQRGVRYVVSIFAADSGMALIAVRPDSSIIGRWEYGFEHKRWLHEFYDPWIDALSRAQQKTWRLSLYGMTAGALGGLANAIWRLDPHIADGGDEIVILPHRSLRNLPLRHMPLPSGKTLDELYARTFLFPTLDHFASQLQAPRLGRAQFCGYVDPDGTLPFSRIEGLLICDRQQLHYGPAVTASAVREAIGSFASLLLSSHGRYDAADPWNTHLELSDTPLTLREVSSSAKVPEIVILGACETGRTRHTVADEPIGFGGILLERGARAVIAPLWPVDDFSSVLMLSFFAEALEETGDISRSLRRASRRVRELSPGDALQHMTDWQRRFTSESGHETVLDDRVGARLSAMMQWLSGLPEDSRPFASPYDWAAYEAVGGYSKPEPPEESNE